MTSATVIAPAPGAADLRHPALVRTFWLLIGVVVLVVLSILSISFGVRAVSVDDIVAALGGHTDTISRPRSSSASRAPCSPSSSVPRSPSPVRPCRP